MNLKKLFNKHYKQLILEGLLASALIGLASGFTVSGILAVLGWLFDFGSVGSVLGIGAGVFAAVFAGVYLLRYRPTPKQVARRIDGLGLDERAITMLELQGDDSLMARIQREDALSNINKAENKRLKLLLSGLVATVTVLSLVFAASTVTVLGLSDAGIIPGGNELLSGGEYGDWLEVNYEADEGGEILGDVGQLVPPGADTEPVVAVADDGWMFLCWDDGLTDPERYESGVEKNMTFAAIFIEIESDSGDDNREGFLDTDGDDAGNLPDEQPSMDMPQYGQPEEGPSDGPPEDEGDKSDQIDPNGAGGKWNDANQFIDGNQYYRDQLDLYYELAMEIFESGGEIPPELREFFENYFDSI